MNDNRGQGDANVALKGFLQLGILIGGCGFITLFFVPRDSAEFYISICNSGIGLALIVGVGVMLRFSR